MSISMQTIKNWYLDGSLNSYQAISNLMNFGRSFQQAVRDVVSWDNGE